MAFKVLVDANIVLDFTLKRDQYEVSKRVFELAIGGDVHVFITPSIVHITAYWLTKAYGKQKAKEIILSLLVDIKVIDANHKVVLNAMYSKIDDIEDALQYFTALHHNLDYVITRDKIFKKMAMPALPVYSPEDFFKEVYTF